MDRHAAEALAVEDAEVSPVTGQQYVASTPDGRGKHWAILVGYRERGFTCLEIRVGSGQMHLCEEGVQHRKALGRLDREIAPRLLDDIAVRAAFMACVDEKHQELPNGTVGLGCLEENIGVQEDPHPQPA